MPVCNNYSDSYINNVPYLIIKEYFTSMQLTTRQSKIRFLLLLQDESKHDRWKLRPLSHWPNALQLQVLIHIVIVIIVVVIVASRKEIVVVN